MSEASCAGVWASRLEPLPFPPRGADSMGMPLTEHRFTVDEFQRMGEAGVFPAEARVELLDGQIVEMTPIGPAHNGCVAALVRLLGRRLPESAWLWV